MTRWALVTAGAQGLGEALSRHLLGQGFNVVVHFRSSAAAAEALVGDHDAGRVVPVAADLSTREGQLGLITAVREHAGDQLSVIINNASVYDETPLLDVDIDQWEKAINLTCTGAFHLIQELHPLMGAGGRIINIGDSWIDRLQGHTEATPYYIAKYGVYVLTRSFAPLLAAREITVNLISPGWLENSVGPENPDLPAGRRGTFADMTGALDYLLSDAAAYVSGTNIVVSGGYNV